MKGLLVLFLVVFTHSAWTQLPAEYDTVLYHTRMNGAIDSMDVSGSYLPTTFDGGRTVLSPQGLSSGNLFFAYSRPQFGRFYSWEPLKFSALPHIGFAYSFGGQGTQFMKSEYQHAFSKNVLLSMKYNRNNGQGVIRNSAFVSNEVDVQLLYTGRHYSTFLRGAFTSNDIGHSGGLFTDTLIENFGLEFSPVRKTNAHSINRNGEVIWENYVDFNADSLRSIGLRITHGYKIRNRTYTESDTLAGLYSAIYIDSTSTRDHLNHAQLGNGVGVYFSNQTWTAHASFNHVYWEYKNVGPIKDSVEVGVEAYGRYLKKGVQLQNHFQMNMIGRYGEWSNKLDGQLRLKRAKIQSGIMVGQLAPEVYQRYYLGNHASYTMNESTLQRIFRASASADVPLIVNRLSLKAFADYTSLEELYVYSDNEWNVDSLQRSFFSAGISSSVRFGPLYLVPKAVYSLDKEGYLPKIQGYMRAYVKGRLFKAKKLEALIGVDYSYVSSFENRVYNPYMDTYDWSTSSTSFGHMHNLHAFLSLGIEEFRFFFRYENIGYFWSDKKMKVMEQYPLAGGRLRIGLTWDFFN